MMDSERAGGGIAAADGRPATELGLQRTGTDSSEKAVRMDMSEEADGAGRTSGGEGPRSTGMQEKNRIAQRRFRMRQKEKVSTLEAHIAELNARIQALEVDKANQASRVALLLRALQAKDDELGQAHIRSAMMGSTIDEEKIEAFEEDLQLSVYEGRDVVLDAESIRKLTREDLVSIWKEYVKHFSRLLNQLGTRHQAQAQERISKLTQEVTCLGVRVGICNPTVSKSMSVKRLEETVNIAADDTPERWRNLLRALNLSPAQKLELQQLHEVFKEKLQPIQREREDLANQLMNARPCSSTSRLAARTFLSATEAVNGVRANLREEHVLKLDWICTIFNQLLTPVQVAHMFVQSWPYSPDTLAMAAWQAAEDGHDIPLPHRGLPTH